MTVSFLYHFRNLSNKFKCYFKHFFLEEQVIQGIMILPVWPTQVWWPQLLKMLIAFPLVLPKQEDLLSLSHSPQILHPLRRKLTMLPCLLSGNQSRIEEFQRRLLSSSWPPGETEQRNSTVPTLQSDKSFVIRGRSVTFNHL